MECRKILPKPWKLDYAIKQMDHDPTIDRVIVYKAMLPSWDPTYCLGCETMLVAAEKIKRRCLSCLAYLKASEFESWHVLADIREEMHGYFTLRQVSKPVLICFQSHLAKEGWVLHTNPDSKKLFAKKEN